VNWNFSPVLDIANNPNSSAIVQVKRAFSANPAVVGKMGGEMISGMQDSGVIATAKHFPGHGDAAGDSHLGQVVLTKSWQEITRNELVPFIDAINRGVDTVMVGHITVKSLASLPGLDKDCARLPASLNSFLIQKVLRQDLGHRGLVLTDDLSMGAITSVTRSQGAAAEAAILAGADVMLMRKGAEKSVIPYLCQKSSDDSVAGRRLASRIRESYERVMATKQKYKINSPKSLAHLDEAVSTSAHRNTAETIWNRANDLYAKDPSREDEYTPGVSSSRSASGQLKDNLKDALRGLRELMGK
jgi:beta-N-acetylhexosaminidase